MSEGQNDFYTLQSLATFAGTTGATTFVTNGLQRALGLEPRWLGLAVAEVICLATAYLTHDQLAGGTVMLPSSYFVAFVNGFLVYATAAGTTAAANTALNGTSANPVPTRTAENRGALNVDVVVESPSRRRRFFDPWF